MLFIIINLMHKEIGCFDMGIAVSLSMDKWIAYRQASRQILLLLLLLLLLFSFVIKFFLL